VIPSTRSLLIALLLLCPSPVAAQEFAPGVELLARIKSHLREELSHTPNYTCLETVSRFRRDKGSHARLALLDSIRLEIVYSDRREWYDVPGNRKSSVDDPVSFVGIGMMGNGAFAVTLRNILEGGRFIYRGEGSLGSRKVVRYDFHLSRMLNALKITIPGGSGMVGEEGSLWVDPETLDLVRLESRATEIPPFLPLDEASMTVNYARMQISGYNALLAQQSNSHMINATGESFNDLEFTRCRAYSAESAIRFDAEPLPENPAVPETTRTEAAYLPALLAVTVQLITPVSEKDIVGALVEARSVGNVSQKGRVLIPNGSMIHGRIRRLEHDAADAAFVVGIEFTDIEFAGGRLLPFYADLIRIEKNPRIREKLVEEILLPGRNGVEVKEETVTLPELPGVASFFVTGKTFTLPAGFQMVWRTRGPIR
jgi:hypothetical protein